MMPFPPESSGSRSSSIKPSIQKPWPFAHFFCVLKIDAPLVAPALFYLFNLLDPCIHPCFLTWFGAFIHRAIVDLVFKLWSVVVHVDDEDVQIDGVFNLVAVHVHGMGPQLGCMKTQEVALDVTRMTAVNKRKRISSFSLEWASIWKKTRLDILYNLMYIFLSTSRL